jgi:hypothetical protein
MRSGRIVPEKETVRHVPIPVMIFLTELVQRDSVRVEHGGGYGFRNTGRFVQKPLFGMLPFVRLFVLQQQVCTWKIGHIPFTREIIIAGNVA